MGTVRTQPYGQATQLQQGGGSPALPRTGLIGSEQAMQTGLDGAMRYVGNGGRSGNTMSGFQRSNYGLGTAGQAAGTAGNPVAGYMQGGEQAQRMNAAFSGALGADAQAQAYANFSESPGQQYLREQADRGLTRNAAAIGGLGGGAVRSALQEQAIGMAAQDFQNQFDRRGTVADRGLAAGQTGAEIMMGRERNATNAATAASSAAASMANSSRNAQLQRDLAAAGYQFDSGNNFAAGRTNAGNNIANNIAGSTSNLANYISQQGANSGNLYANAGQQQGSSFTNYADNAAGIRGNASGNFMGVSGVPQNTQNSFADYGAMLSGVGGALQSYNNYQQPQNLGGVGGTGYQVNPNYGYPGASAASPSYPNTA